MMFKSFNALSLLVVITLHLLTTGIHSIEEQQPTQMGVGGSVVVKEAQQETTKQTRRWCLIIQMSY
jgi:hypothetical protein